MKTRARHHISLVIFYSSKSISSAGHPERHIFHGPEKHLITREYFNYSW